MNRQRTRLWQWLLAAVLLGPALLAAGCTDDSPEAASPATTPPSVTEPPTPTAGPGPDTSGADGPTDACELLTEAELSDVFPGAVPKSKGLDYGLGYLECVWGESRDQVVRVSLVPAESLQTDFVDQTAGERAVLLAAATGDDQDADLARATQLSLLVSQRLG